MHSFSKKNIVLTLEGRQAGHLASFSLHASQSLLFTSTEIQRSRGSGVLPEMIFTGENTNLGFHANVPI
jgi:hypothetical protein